MHTKLRQFLNAAIAASVTAGTAAAVAQPAATGTPYPVKPLRIVVPFSAGGPTDITVRSIAPRMTELMGQSIIVDNRAGANGIIGAENVAKSPPDGYTLLMGTASVIAINMVTYSKLPYKGAAPAVIDVIGGQVNGMFVDLPVISPYVKAGRVKALAVASAKRSPYFPDVPTTKEAGYPNVELQNYYALMLPAKTPREIVMKLYDAVVKSVNTPAVHEKLVSVGSDPLTMTPDEFGAFLCADIEKWRKVVKEAGVKIEQ